MPFSPSIIILVPILLWFGGIRQIERYAKLYEGVYFVSISAGFILAMSIPTRRGTSGSSQGLNAGFATASNR